MAEWTRESLISHFGYNSQLINLNDLVDIWNIIGTSYIIKFPYLILADGLIEKIDDHISSNNIRFTRKWYQYKTKNSNHFNNIISVSDYNQLVKQQQIEAEQQKIREEERERKNQLNLSKDLETLAALKESYQSSWIDSKWINSIIGTYDNPFAEYYWTLITKDRYKVIDWKGNVIIREDVYKAIENDNTFKTYSGKNFLTRSFKNKKGYAAYIKGTYPYLTHDESGWGVYGIYYTEDEEPELIYIGMTGRGFKTRWEEHYNIFQGNSKPEAGMILYQQNLDANKISFGKLIDVKELNYEGTITTRDVEAMELALISIYQPKYNVMGRSKPYVL